MTKATSPYLNLPLRTLEEALRDILMHSLGREIRMHYFATGTVQS